MGNFENGSSRTGCSSLSISAEHAIRARPLISIAHDPQTSSRQFESYVIGVVFLPSRVTGVAAISMRQEITFMFGLYGSSNSSQRGCSFGLPCRLILIMTDFLSAIFTIYEYTPGFLTFFGRGGLPFSKLIAVQKSLGTQAESLTWE